MKLFRIKVEYQIRVPKESHLQNFVKPCFVLADDAAQSKEKVEKKLTLLAPDEARKSMMIGEPEEIPYTDCTTSLATFIQ